MRLARANGQVGKVLEYGEEILARHPADVEAHLEMAGAAEEHGLRDLARWFLEQGCEESPDHVGLMKTLRMCMSRTRTGELHWLCGKKSPPAPQAIKVRRKSMNFR